LALHSWRNAVFTAQRNEWKKPAAPITGQCFIMATEDEQRTGSNVSSRKQPWPPEAFQLGFIRGMGVAL
jgi:hypothetical protein